MARLAQYWLMDFYSQFLDQRMSIVRRMKMQIMMGQNRQTPDILTDHEEQDGVLLDTLMNPKMNPTFQAVYMVPLVI